MCIRDSPSTLAVTGANVPVAPMGSAPLSSPQIILPCLTRIVGCRLTSPEVDRRRSGLPEVGDDVDVVTCSIWPPDWSFVVVLSTGNVAGVLLLGSTYSAL